MRNFIGVPDNCSSHSWCLARLMDDLPSTIEYLHLVLFFLAERIFLDLFLLLLLPTIHMKNVLVVRQAVFTVIHIHQALRHCGIAVCGCSRRRDFFLDTPHNEDQTQTSGVTTTNIPLATNNNNNNNNNKNKSNIFTIINYQSTC